MLGLPTLGTLENKERPDINSRYIPSTQYGAARDLNLDNLVYWVKRTPECIGIVKRITSDIFTNANFIAVDKSKPTVGRPAATWKKDSEDNAESFWNKNNGQDIVKESGNDWVMTGDGYLWKGSIASIEDDELKEMAIRHYASVGIDMRNSIDIKTLKMELKQFLDEDPNGITDLQVIPSSMTQIDHNNKKIKAFVQKSRFNPGDTLRFTPEEVIHAKFMRLDGRVYGFSPMESDYYAIKTINAIWDYNYNYFANGVKLDRAWLFIGNPNQDFIDKHEETLKDYKQVTNAHGDIIVSGADDIKVETLNKIGEEMEFRKVAIAAVGRLAFSFNMPADILSPILGVDIKGTAVGSDIEDSGYYRNIEQAQRYWERLLNTQLFIPHFGVEIHFERQFRQDMIRQIQYQNMAAPFVDFLFKRKYPVSDEYIHKILQIDRNFLTEGKINRETEEAKPLVLPDKPGANKGNAAEAKKKEQKPQSNNQALTGS